MQIATTIGVDAHSQVHVAAAVDPQGRVIAEHAITANPREIARFTSDTYPAPRGESADEGAVDLVPVRRLERPVSLAEIEDLPEFQDFDLVNDPELSVMEVSPEVWSRLLELSEAALAYSTQENQE